MLQTSALWHAMTRSPRCKARCSKHISISDLLGYFLKSGTTERHLIVLWNFKSWSNMKFICNIPLNVTKYINNVKKKLNQSENFWKTAFTTLICSQRNKNPIHVCVQRNVWKWQLQIRIVPKTFSTITKYTHLISTHSSQTEIEVTTI